MNGDVLPERQQTHSMPRLVGEGLVVTFDTLELASPFYSLLCGGIDAAGVLGEVESCFSHRCLFLSRYELHQPFQTFVAFHVFKGI